MKPPRGGGDGRLGHDDRRLHRHHRRRRAPARSVFAVAAGRGLRLRLRRGDGADHCSACGASKAPRSAATAAPHRRHAQSSFRAAFTQVWAEPKARRFAIFVFVSMLAYSAQELILEPFAGAVFGFTPGETTKLSACSMAGTLIGMTLVPLIGAVYPRSRRQLRIWTVGGCLASAVALLCSRSRGAWSGRPGRCARPSSCSASPTASMRSPRSAR